MRDPKRIETIINLLRTYWQCNPDLRLGQIIVNLTPDRFRREYQENGYPFRIADPFHVEDTIWEDTLRAELRNIAKEHKP